MANIAVYITCQDDRPTVASLELVGQARRIASKMGATLYGVLVQREAPRPDEPVLAALGYGGTDRVFWYSLGMSPRPPEWAPVEALVRTADRLPLSLIFVERCEYTSTFVQTLADRLRAARITDARVEVQDGALRIIDEAANVPPPIASSTLICEIPSGRYAAATGGDEIEVMYAALDEVITEKAIPQQKNVTREATLELPAQSLPDASDADKD